jgi:hypothetical protein
VNCCEPVETPTGLMHAAGCPGIPLFCPECKRDCQVWPTLPNGPFPRVNHEADGSHTFHWEVHR